VIAEPPAIVQRAVKRARVAIDGAGPCARREARGDRRSRRVPPLYPFGSFIGELIETQRKLRAFDATTLVPGHGPVMHDNDFLDRTIALLVAVNRRSPPRPPPACHPT
jgi:hypothetical protein